MKTHIRPQGDEVGPVHGLPSHRARSPRPTSAIGGSCHLAAESDRPPPVLMRRAGNERRQCSRCGPPLVGVKITPVWITHAAGL